MVRFLSRRDPKRRKFRDSSLSDQMIRSPAHSTALKFILFGALFASLLGFSNGDCIYHGQRIRSDTVWSPDDCTICVCPQPKLRQEVKCSAMRGCVQQNFLSLDSEQGLNDLQNDQAPFTFSFLPSGGSAPDVSGLKETGITVTEGEKVTLTTADFVRLPGANLAERKIRFMVKEPLNSDQGRLDKVDQPGQPVTEFTLEDLRMKKITYQAPTEKELQLNLDEQGIVFSFGFVVVDDIRTGQRGDLPPDQRFYIRVLSGNVKPPTFDQTNVTIWVYQGSSEPVPPEYLKVSDPDTSPQDLRFQLTQGPEHGRLVNLIDGVQVDVREGIDEPHDKFVSSAFRYIHDGRSLDDDQLQITVSDGKHTGLLTVFVKIRPVDREAPFPDGGTMAMELPEGTTKTVTHENIAYKDNNSTAETIFFRLTEVPEQGVLQQGDPNETIKRKLSPNLIFSQQDVDNGFITYVAPDEIGLRPIQVYAVFDAYDSRNNTLPNQRLTITVTPINNLPPVVKVEKGLEVPELGRERIPPDAITVTDPDTPSNELTIIVDSPPEFGTLENMRKPGVPVTSFPVQDLVTGFMVYISTPKENEEPTKDRFLFHVTDGVNESPVNTFNITILPTNDEKPVVSTEPLYVNEEGSEDIRNNTLRVTDRDTPPPELVFTLSRMPEHGEVRVRQDPRQRPSDGKRLEPGDTFTYLDVLKGLVSYTHDDTKTRDDNIDLRLTDGVHEVPATIEVKIEPEANEMPRIVVNTGLQVPKGAAETIDYNVLRATDVDSVIEQLKFTITEDVDHGRLLLTLNSGETVELRAGSPHNSFIQDDLNNGRLKYSHNFNDPAGSVSFIFDLSDPEGNTLPNQNFRILVLEDRTYPEIVNNTGVTVDEKEHVPITNIELAATDSNSPPERLRFIITSGPDQGRLEHVDQPGIPVTEFRQGDLDRGVILYNHTSDQKNPLDYFTFKVTDGTNEIEARFQITIVLPKDSAPTVTFTSLRLNQGERGAITPQELRAEDEDTDDTGLVFDIVRAPYHGRILIRQDDGSETATRSFTMDDILRNKLIYEHDGGPSTKDSFDFVVSDGTHSYFFVNQNGVKKGPLQDAQEFPIIIKAISNAPPTISKNLGLTFLSYDEREQKPVGIIDHQVLQAKDPDTPDDELYYVIVVPPKHGQVEIDGQPTNRFTQDDLNRGRIRYVLTNLDTPETSDFFIARLQDNKVPPNIIDGIKFTIQWSWIYFDQPEYSVQENVGVVRIVIRKTGNLNQYSLVRAATQPGTATDAPGGDFVASQEEIQFEEGQNQKTFSVTIRDDRNHEGPEEFYALLSKPVFALLREPKRTRVIINDEEDKGTVQFDRPVFYINEKARVLQATVIRTGDLYTSVSVACLTRPGSARDPQDFVRLGPENRVTFAPGQDKATCTVQIVDDNVPESQEEFELVLEQPTPNIQLGVISRARVIIQEPMQQIEPPTIRFAQVHCLVREAQGRYQFEVLREGSDLSQPSTVICSTEAWNPVSATPGQDYVHTAERVTFGPGQRRAVCSVQIIDDNFYEGNESFYLVLSQPSNGRLGQPAKSTVTIFDTDSEVPTVQFESINLVVEETAGRLDIPIIRTGGLVQESTVRCFTLSRSAQAGTDYADRPNADVSVVVFRRGEQRQVCSVSIIDDSIYEPDEQFFVVLGSPQSAKLGSQDKACVTITNREDVPKIYFESPTYDVEEPQRAGTMSTVMLTVMRSGDASRQSEVRITTRDATAIASRDYHPKSQMLVFKPGETAKRFAVEILYDNEREPTETFNVYLGPDQPVNADIGQPSMAQVCIHDRTPEPAPVTAAPPIVISLSLYENVPAAINVQPPAGYPLMCLTPCDTKHPQHLPAPSCAQRPVYRWEMATDTDRDGNRIFTCIADNTPFTTATAQVLDSIYFAPNTVIRCGVDQGSGVVFSADITISREGVCANPRTPETKGSQKSLTTNIQYNDPSAAQYPNTIHIQVTIPHRDGIMPIISTFPIHNMKLLLNDQVYRSQHICSNLVPNQDPKIRGFFDVTTTTHPYQTGSALMDASIRGNVTVGFYRHLNLDTCQWTFDANYDMTTLVDKCGGTVNTNARNGQFGQRAVTVTVPLYVTYVYAVPPNNWGSIDHRTTLEVSFQYDTALWHDQVRTTNDNVDAKINVVRVRLSDSGCLIITIKTQTKFRGTFVMNHPRLPGQESRLIAPQNVPVRFTLQLEWQQETYDYPMQTWQATSDLSLRDYTGDYTLELIPCMATRPDYYAAGVSGDLNCEPRAAKQFILPIAFQQANRPMPVVYSLNTEFQLSHNDVMFQSDAVATPAPVVTDDTVFGRGETVHGCVMWNPVQDLKDAYKLEIQRLYVCSGKDGYTPVYDPTARSDPQYGCLQPSKNLRHRFLLLDRNDPNHVDRGVSGSEFQADFIDRQVKFKRLRKRSGLDGFVFRTDPLYELGPGRQWYLQVMYVITSADETTRYRRASMLPVNSMKLRNGTNIRQMELKSSDFQNTGFGFGFGAQTGPFSSLTTIIGISVAAVVLLIVAALLAACFVARRRRAAPRGYMRPGAGYQMNQGRAYSPATARVRKAPKGYQLAKGTEV